MKIELQIISQEDLVSMDMSTILNLMNKSKMCKYGSLPSNMSNEVKEIFIAHIDNNLKLLSKEYLNRVSKDFTNLNNN